MADSSPYFNRLKPSQKQRPSSMCNVPHSISDKMAMPNVIGKFRLGDEFFHQDCAVLAKALLGKVLVRRLEGKGELVCGRIVETEAYLGPPDKAAHSFNGRTARNQSMFMKPGTMYVYAIYGMYHCLNISSLGDGSGVLLRAVEPLFGTEQMQLLRCLKQKKDRIFKHHQLCNGPSKLCLSFGVDKTFNMLDVTQSPSIWIEDWAPSLPFTTVTSTRIGLSRKAQEWIMAPLRFYILGSSSVSVRDATEERKQAVQSNLPKPD